jgi:hypothetical protein
MRQSGSVLSNEVLLDHTAWEEMQGFLAGHAWPVAEKPYDVRVFLVVKDLE